MGGEGSGPGKGRPDPHTTRLPAPPHYPQLCSSLAPASPPHPKVLSTPCGGADSFRGICTSELTKGPDIGGRQDRPLWGPGLGSAPPASHLA